MTRSHFLGIVTATALTALFLMGSHSARVQGDLVLPFTYGAAAGYLNVDDGRSHPFKGTSTVNKFGFNDDMDQTEESIWDGNDLGGPLRCFTIIGTTAVALYVSSDDENDASDNNGVEVTVEYLDANWDDQTVTAALGVASAGGTVFAQVGTEVIMRVNRAYTGDVAAVGNIYIATDTTDGDADGIPDDIANQYVAGITIGEGQTLQACYTVPNGTVALMTRFFVGNASSVGNILYRLRASVEGAASRTKELHPVGSATPWLVPHDPPLRFAEKTDLELTGDGITGANNDASGTFDLVLIPE